MFTIFEPVHLNGRALTLKILENFKRNQLSRTILALQDAVAGLFIKCCPRFLIFVTEYKHNSARKFKRKGAAP